MIYGDFLDRKTPRMAAVGREPSALSTVLYPFQSAIVRWACRKGRAAIFADCGLGKTLMQLEWARQMRPANGRALIVAPLAVAEQTIEEAKKLGLVVEFANGPSLASYQITNYQKLGHFVGAPYDCLVLDESSILKSIDGKTRTMILRDFTSIPFRLACTATPAPNDLSELANHAEYVGAMTRAEMLASFFVHDMGTTGGAEWRLKGHAEAAFWRWVASWAVYVRRPSDLGFDDDGFVLPGLSIVDEVVECDWRPDGQLFYVSQGGISGDNDARRATIGIRVDWAAKMIARHDGQVLVWCGLNDEGRKLAAALGDECVLIEGSTGDDEKVAREHAWRHGAVKVLITKPSMFGFGLNWQHCARVIFLGLSHSYEQYYQAIRRCWRFGQARPVAVSIIVSQAEQGVSANVHRKEAAASDMAGRIVSQMREGMMEELEATSPKEQHIYETAESAGDGWKFLLGDATERISEVAAGSVGLTVFSPPFASLYTYSSSPRDLGNSSDYEQFFEHFGFMVPELLRVLMPGRRACVHVQQITTTKATHGVIGFRDFRADVVRLFVEHGFVYDGEVVIDKDPQAQAIRTKSKALMFVQKNKDSAWSRPAMADYILLFRAPGENGEPVKTDVTNEEWILWARPIWYGIRETETLNYAEARNDKDERHICPLQLETINRCVRLWSNQGDLVLSPFAGIGSEGFVSLKLGRRFIGIELKRQYWEIGCRNLSGAKSQLALFEA
jgi:DNA modification methylase